MRPVALICLALAGLQGCVMPPRLAPGLACDIPTASEAQALSVMKQESTQLTGTPFVPGNTVHLLENGPQTYAAMQAAIIRATRRIDMESYEFDGAAGEQFATLLAARRARGVQVDLVYDAYGTNAPAGLFAGLRRAGVNVIEYSPLDPTKLKSLDLNRRDHRKLLVIDNRLVFTGGVNIAEVYKNRPGSAETNNPKKFPWRDTDVEISGPVVGNFEQMFLQTWAEQKGFGLPSAAPRGGAAGRFHCAGARRLAPRWQPGDL